MDACEKNRFEGLFKAMHISMLTMISPKHTDVATIRRRILAFCIIDGSGGYEYV